MQAESDDDGAVCFRLLLDTDAALARVLNVTPPAVRKAAEWGKIEREPDGRWEVFAVLDGWRTATNPDLQRPTGARRPWLNPGRPITSALVTELIRRTRSAGGTVQAQGGDGKWREAPDPIHLLRKATQLAPAPGGTPLDEAAVCELDAILPGASSWLDWLEWAADGIAERCKGDAAAVRALLEEEVRAHVAFLATQELRARRWTGAEEDATP